MKRINVTMGWFLLLACLFFSCGKKEENVVNLNGMAQVTWMVSELAMNEFEATRAGDAMPFSRLTFYLKPEQGEVIEVTQEESEEDFCQLSCTMPYGTYEILIVGHNSSAAASVNSSLEVSFINDRVTDTFHYYLALDVDAETPAVIDALLRRVVSKFELQTTDAIPSDAAEVVITVDGVGSTLNGRNGRCVSTSGVTRTLTIPASAVGQTDIKFSSYLFMPSEEVTTTITARANNSLGGAIREVTFNDAPLKVNRITNYYGRFFSVGAGFNLSVTSDWDAPISVPF